jgi:hypothetical protein
MPAGGSIPLYERAPLSLYALMLYHLLRNNGDEMDEGGAHRQVRHGYQRVTVAALCGRTSIPA